MVSRDGLGAVWQAGHQLRAEARQDGAGRPSNEILQGGGLSLTEIFKEHKLGTGTGYRWIAMSFAPREAAPSSHRATANAFQQTLDKSSYLANWPRSGGAFLWA